MGGEVRARGGRTLNEGTIEGTVFTQDNNTVVIEQRGGEKSTFRIIRTAAIKEIEVVALPAAPTPSTGGKWADKRSAEDEEELPKIDIEVVAAREKRAVEKAEEEAKMWHEGVTGRAMLIFEALSKTMPCEWLPMGNTLGIVVLREVLIASPYDADSCRASPSHPDTAALPRVQKVLAGELAKLSL
eukprot:Transcript_12206.p1 GENE.Transcript_12206~~Transcript_12206.p1  ORF type:complete len:186 (+),score=71.26 Transcript_12206:312-869(+)